MAESCLLLSASATVADGSLCARLELRDTSDSPVWVDCLAAKLCGFCSPQLDQDATSSGKGENTDAAALAAVSQHCVLTSSPHVVVASLALQPGQSRSFDVHCEQLPPGLPPSFAGEAICCEYVLIVTLRTMTPPSGSWWSRWSSSSTISTDAAGADHDLSTSATWARGPVSLLRVPLNINGWGEWLDASAQGKAIVPGEPARCQLSCVESSVAAADADGANGGLAAAAAAAAAVEELAAGDDDDDDATYGNGEEEEEEAAEEETDEVVMEGGDHSGGVANGAHALPRRSFMIQLADRPFASLDFASEVFRVGGAVRGVLLLAAGSPAVTRLRVSLLLEEHAAPEEPAGSGAAMAHTSLRTHGPLASRTISKLDLGRNPAVRRISFELPVPSHLPPDAKLHGADRLAVELAWAVLVTFELGGATDDGAGNAGLLSPAGLGATAPIGEQVPWRLPIRMLPKEATRPRSTLRTRALYQQLATRRLCAGQMAFGLLEAPGFTSTASDEIRVAV